jgi:hypothetical protein
MKNETTTAFAEPLRGWAYSAGLPAGIALLIYTRLHFGYDWLAFTRIGLFICCIALVHLIADVIAPEFFNGLLRCSEGSPFM